jgi:hypothetical protein
MQPTKNECQCIGGRTQERKSSLCYVKKFLELFNDNNNNNSNNNNNNNNNKSNN